RLSRCPPSSRGHGRPSRGRTGPLARGGRHPVVPVGTPVRRGDEMNTVVLDSADADAQDVATTSLLPSPDGSGSGRHREGAPHAVTTRLVMAVLAVAQVPLLLDLDIPVLRP